ncbi:Hypothetical predicted protein [Paramuricea clavata]|uniref:Uncharacterized protein n=1 Tax=Paramuricea clavata TaxID=317549 RepID=A0A6S7I882_PARCT|nr:Hypothetical predicted protein [Paramuricea clavata]
MAEYDARKIEQMKSCADNRRGAKESCIKPEKKKGTMVTAKNDSKVVTRNSSQSKVISTKSAKHDDKEVEPKVPRQSNPQEQKTLQQRSKRNVRQPARFEDYVNYEPM